MRAQAPSNGGQSLAQWLLLILGFVAFYAVYFSRVLLRQVALAPGDGEIFYLPLFHLAPWHTASE